MAATLGLYRLPLVLSVALMFAIACGGSGGSRPTIIPTTTPATPSPSIVVTPEGAIALVREDTDKWVSFPFEPQNGTFYEYRAVRMLLRDAAELLAPFDIIVSITPEGFVCPPDSYGCGSSTVGKADSGGVLVLAIGPAFVSRPDIPDSETPGLREVVSVTWISDSGSYFSLERKPASDMAGVLSVFPSGAFTTALPTNSPTATPPPQPGPTETPPPGSVVEPTEWRLTKLAKGDSLELAIVIGSSSCNSLEKVVVDSTSESVRIDAFIRRRVASGGTPLACTADLTMKHRSVSLVAPLGDRQLLGCDPNGESLIDEPIGDGDCSEAIFPR